MKKSKKPLWIALLIVCLLIAAAGAVYLWLSMGGRQVSRDDFTPSQTQETQIGTGDEPTAALTETPPTQEPSINTFGYELADPGDFDVDFDQLESVNRDIYAWLYVPGTDVDYPVVCSTSNGDDSFYLNHNIYRQYQFSGSVYSELKNRRDMSDPVTVLYGHNMLNGSMFASLHRFEDAQFFNKNTTAFLFTEDKVYTYLIYAAYDFDDRHILNSYHLDDEDGLTDYLESTLNPHSYNANVRKGVELNTDDRILVLSTCTNGAANTRYLVQGVLVNEQEK